MFRYEELDNPFQASVDMQITLQDVYNLYISNAILRYHVRGCFIYGFPAWVKSYLQLQEQDMQDICTYPPPLWPYENCQVTSDQRVSSPNVLQYDIPKIPPILKSHFFQIYTTFMTNYWDYKRCGVPEQKIVYMKNLAISYVNFLMLGSTKQHYSQSFHRATIQDLWNLRLRGRSSTWTSSKEFLTFVYEPKDKTNFRTRGIGNVHKQSITILRYLLDLNKEMSYYITEEIERSVLRSQYPFRFLFNNVTQVCTNKRNYNFELYQAFELWMLKSSFFGANLCLSLDICTAGGAN